MIEYKYIIEKEDCLQQQLFAASKSKLISKTRYKTKVVIPLFYLIIGLGFYMVDQTTSGILFVGIGILWYFIYPLYLRKKYFNYYAKYIDENYTNRFGKVESLAFEEEYIISKTFVGESKMKISEIVEISEISDYYYLKFSIGSTLIIPKNFVNNSIELEHEIKKIAARYNIEHIVNLEWKWR